ncbi:MAG UNVERIFIED_CONTAM: hypothetical protein LVR18_03575 [Planctomycetaceae bacterium]|jgi:type IV secretory pathway VirB4 component
MPHQNISYNLEKIFGLTSEESHSLGKTQYDSSFIIKPSGHSSTMINFNSAGLDKYMHILSCNDDSKKLFIEAKSAKGESLGNWLPELYRMLEK